MDSTFIQEVLLKINGNDAEQTIKRLQQTIKNCAAEKEKLVNAKPDQKNWSEEEWKNWQKWTREIASAERQLKKYGTTSDYVKATLDNLSGKSLKDLNASLKTMQNALDSGKIDRKTRAWSELNEAIKKTKVEIERVKNEQRNLTIEGGSFLQKFGEKWVGLTTLVHTSIHAFNSLMGKISGYVNQYAQMEQHMADVSKYTGMAAEEVKKLNEDFSKLDTKTGRAALNDLAADAGRLGLKSRQDVLGFVEAADQLKTALGTDLGEDAVKNIGKLATLFGDDKVKGLKGAMLATGSAISVLGKSSSASEAYIVNFTGRLASAAATAGMTQAQVMGIASVMDQGMVSAEKGSTALSKIINKIYKDTEKMAQAVGLNVQQFSDLVKKDANAALIEFAKAVERMGGMDKIAPMLGDISLSGAGVSSMMLTLAKDTQKVVETQELAKKAFDEGTAATDAFNIANNTAAAQLQKTQNKINGLKTQIGEQLLPVYLASMQASASISKILAQLVKIIGNNKIVFSILAGTIALLTINMKLANKETKIAITLKRGWQAIVVSCRMAAMLFNAALALMTGNTTRAAAAMRLLNITMKANPYTAIAALIVSISSVLLVLATRTKQLTQEQKNAIAIQKQEADLQRATLEQTKEQEARLRRLTAIVHSNVYSLQERRKAVAEIKKIVPEYNATINEEGRITKENSKAIDEYIRKLREKARAQAAEEILQKKYQEQIAQEDRVARMKTAVALREQRLVEYLRSQGKGESYVNIWLERAKDDSDGLWKYNGKFKELAGKLREARGWLAGANSDLSTTNNLIKSLETNVDKAIKKAGITPAATSPEPPAPTPDPVTPTNTPAPTTPDKLADSAAAMKQALQDISEQYAKGKMQSEGGVSAYATMLAKQLGIIEEYREASKLIEATDEQRAKHTETLSKEEAAVKQKQLQDDLLQLTAYKDAELALADNARATGKTSQRQYEQEAYNIQAKYLQDKLLLLRSYNADAEQIHAAELEIEKHAASKNAKVSKELADTIAKMKAAAMKADPAAARKAAEEEIDALKDALVKEAREKGLGDETIKQLEDYIDKQKAQLSVNAKVEIGELDVSKDFGFSKLFKAIKKFNKQAEGEMGDGWEKIAGVVCASIDMISSTLNAASQLFQANCDLETAKVEQEYDRRIADAEGNDELQQQLEQEKQQRLQEIKAKYAEKEFKMKIATAIADTAKNAIIAYGEGKNPVTGAIFAAMATAAGMVQIAIIKKQYEAQKAAGFFEGGYTGGTDWRKPAGIVHEGEYVLPHEALANPAITPMLDIIETARRNNRLASLTPEDVSRAVTAPQAAAAMAGRTAVNTASAAAAAMRTASNTAAPVVTIKDGDQTAAAVRRLNRKLDEGIESYVVLSGPQGLDRQWKRYQRLTGK